jgi:hypothetical protein
VSRIHLVQGDTRPQVYVQLRQPGSNDLLDVSMAEVRLKFKRWNNETVLFELIGVLLPGTLQANLVDADTSQYLTPGSGGRVRFDFITGNLDLPIGRYRGEIEVAYSPYHSVTPYPRLQFILREQY